MKVEFNRPGEHRCVAHDDFYIGGDSADWSRRQDNRAGLGDEFYLYWHWRCTWASGGVDLIASPKTPKTISRVKEKLAMCMDRHKIDAVPLSLHQGQSIEDDVPTSTRGVRGPKHPHPIGGLHSSGSAADRRAIGRWRIGRIERRKTYTNWINSWSTSEVGTVVRLPTVVGPFGPNLIVGHTEQPPAVADAELLNRIEIAFEGFPSRIDRVSIEQDRAERPAAAIRGLGYSVAERPCAISGVESS
jgi:hypothetical protein